MAEEAIPDVKDPIDQLNTDTRYIPMLSLQWNSSLEIFFKPQGPLTQNLLNPYYSRNSLYEYSNNKLVNLAIHYELQIRNNIRYTNFLII